jgi:hypothetical protein
VKPVSDHDLARAAWRTARTFGDLCSLGAEFVEGRTAFFPGWGWSVLDEESDAIVAHLAVLQRAGLLTLASQPGRAPWPSHDGAPQEQRTFVCGFADERCARALAELRAEPEIKVDLFRRGESGGTRTAVSARGGIPHAFAGYSAFEEELACFAGQVSSEALEVLERSTYVSAIDLVWGRDSELWKSLRQALDPDDLR